MAAVVAEAGAEAGEAAEGSEEVFDGRVLSCSEPQFSTQTVMTRVVSCNSCVSNRGIQRNNQQQVRREHVAPRRLENGFIKMRVR